MNPESNWRMASDLEVIDEMAPSIWRDRNRRFLLAAYVMDRLYGGPEEGGWWYDSGRLERLISLHRTDESAYAASRRANHLIHLLQKKQLSRYSMAYRGGEVEFYVYQDVVPDFFPEERPHYE